MDICIDMHIDMSIDMCMSAQTDILDIGIFCPGLCEEACSGDTEILLGYNKMHACMVCFFTVRSITSAFITYDIISYFLKTMRTMSVF